MAMAKHEDEFAESALQRIPSLRPPRIPVTLNRRALMQNACAQNQGAFSIKRALQKTSSSTSTSVSAAEGGVEKQKMNRELTKAHRSLESLCDRMWFKQNELFRQLCRYKKLKREAVRRVYQLHQQDLRDQVRIGNKLSVASFFNPLDSQEETSETELEDLPFVLSDLETMHLETILKPAEALKVRRSLSTVTTSANALESSPNRVVTSSTQRSRISLPTIVENFESASRATSASASAPASVHHVELANRNRNDRMKKRVTLDVDDRKALVEPFNMYRIDENGELVAREAKPRSFQVQMPTGKVSYRRRKLLEMERSNYQDCLKRVESFNPEVQSVELKFARGQSHAQSSDANAIVLPQRRSSNYEFVSWVPM